MYEPAIPTQGPTPDAWFIKENHLARVLGSNSDATMVMDVVQRTAVRTGLGFSGVWLALLVWTRTNNDPRFSNQRLRADLCVAFLEDIV